MKDQSGTTNNQYALLIGIDCYLLGKLPDGNYYPNLGGCVRDIANVENFLKSGLKLAESNIFKLTASYTGAPEPPEPRDRWPTYENIVAAFKELTEMAVAGDSVYVHYSGHGGRAKTLVPEQKSSDGIDEALVPMDIHSPKARYLRDIELAVIFQRMVKKGIRLGVVLDSCHSGGMVRGIGDVAVRGIGVVDTSPRPGPPDDPASLVAPPHELAQTWQDLTRGGTRNVSVGSGWLAEPEGYVLLAACRPTESAQEYAFNGRERNGVLTYWLLHSISKLGPGMSAKSLCEGTIVPNVHSQFEYQTPQLQGEGQRSLFGVDVSVVADVATASVLEVDAPNDRVRLLSAGQAFGNRKGAQFAIYPHGTTDFADSSKRQAIVAITEVGATASWAVITSRLSATPIEKGSPALLVDQGSLKLLSKVGLAHRDDLTAPIDQDAALAAIEKAMSGNKWVSLKTETDADTLEYQVAVNEKLEYEIWNPAGHPIANLAPPTRIDDPNAPATVVRRLEHLANYNAVKHLDNHDPQSPLARKLTVELVGYQEDYNPGDKPDPKPFETPGSTPVVTTGQWIFLRIRNNAKQPLNVTVLDLQPDWGIRQIFPAGQGVWFVEIEPGREQMLSLRASLPADYLEGLDVLKVFATVGAANFRRLELSSIDEPPVRGEAQRTSATKGQVNPLEDLMDAISGPQPPVSATRTFTTAAYPSAGWTSSLMEIQVQRS